MRKLNETIRQDLPGRFSELDFFRRNFSRIVNIYEGNIMPPYEVLIHPCSYCNLSCKWCIGSYVTRDINKDKLLETKLNQVSNMKKIIEGILNYKKEGKDYISEKTSIFKVENVSFSGITGEPMISKDAISYAIKELKKSGIRVGMFTNGVLITPDIQKEILKMDYVLISIDAGNAKTYTRLKCNGKENGTFEKVLNNIESLSKQKEKNNSQLDINIGYIINQYNYEQVYELAKILKKIGVHYFRLKTDISSIMILDEEQSIDVKKQIKKVKEEVEDEYFKIIEIHKIGDEKQKIRDFKKCFIHYLYGAISADGKVYPCNYHPKVNGYFYDSTIEKNFGVIWENLMNYEIDKNIPEICPDRCDPFKTRANRLLETAYYIYKDEGISALKEYIYNE